MEIIIIAKRNGRMTWVVLVGFNKVRQRDLAWAFCVVSCPKIRMWYARAVLVRRIVFLVCT